MIPNEEKLVKNLNYHAMDQIPTPTIFKDRLQITYFYIRDHADLLLTVRPLQFDLGV